MIRRQRTRASTACGRVIQLPRKRQVAATRSECTGSALLWPPGDLTRAMMLADGVAEAVLEVFLRKISDDDLGVYERPW
jgi:hypothetical protein